MSSSAILRSASLSLAFLFWAVGASAEAPQAVATPEEVGFSRAGLARIDAYLQNDRGGIHVVGVPRISPLGHLVNLAEITVLAMMTSLLVLAASAAFGVAMRRATTARALFREVRASFYRKLFLAFVAAAMVPVAALALLTRTYVRGNILDSIQSEAARTAASARRRSSRVDRCPWARPS